MRKFLNMQIKVSTLLVVLVFIVAPLVFLGQDGQEVQPQNQGIQVQIQEKQDYEEKEFSAKMLNANNVKAQTAEFGKINIGPNPITIGPTTSGPDNSISSNSDLTIRTLTSLNLRARAINLGDPGTTPTDIVTFHGGANISYGSYLGSVVPTGVTPGNAVALIQLQDIGSDSIISNDRINIGAPQIYKIAMRSNLVNLQPQPNPPASTLERGDLYYNSSGALCIFNGKEWEKIGGAGECK